jgi:uncharacterized protein (DUF2147 family)
MLLTGVLSCLAAEPPGIPQSATPSGLWKTFDDHTHKARGTILIFEKDGVLFGRIESTFNPAEENERCHKCSGDRKNAPVIGLIVMRGMKRHGAEFDGGDILDPENGTLYRCKLTLSRDGSKLMVRGYVGISLFGRTQTWTRVGDGSVKAAGETDGRSVASVAPESAK